MTGYLYGRHIIQYHKSMCACRSPRIHTPDVYALYTFGNASNKTQLINGLKLMILVWNFCPSVFNDGSNYKYIPARVSTRSLSLFFDHSAFAKRLCLSLAGSSPEGSIKWKMNSDTSRKIAPVCSEEGCGSHQIPRVSSKSLHGNSL